MDKEDIRIGQCKPKKVKSLVFQSGRANTVFITLDPISTWIYEHKKFSTDSVVIRNNNVTLSASLEFLAKNFEIVN